ncbi:MAG TPA: sulfotransferase [Rhizomicrobium sp.]|nr:sulfotransferase [Rhizomicrobium sp.]
MTEQESSLQDLHNIVRGPGSPVFNWHGQSPAQLQKILEQGIAHHREGQKEEAERCYRQVLDIAPNQPDALNLLGVLASDAGFHELAIGLMRRALMTRPKDPHIRNNLGHALSQVHEYDEARDHLERAIALKPDFDEAKYNLGRVLRNLGETGLALKLWQEVWESDDRVFAALVGITGIYADEGRFEQAEATAREVIERLPHRPAGYISYSQVHKFKEDDGTLAEIERQLADETISEQDKVALHYSAGKICDDLKRYSNAFEHFDLANRLACKAYDHQPVETMRQRVKTVFSKRFYADRKGWGHKSEAPVFIVGMPRSGTTLTEQILSAHPDVFAGGEIETRQTLRGFSEEISPTRETYPLSELKLTPYGAEIVGRRYMDDLRRRTERPAERMTNKLPHNFEMLGILALVLPNVKIIHCRRNPMDTCLSCWTKNFNDAHGYNRSLEDLGRYYRGYFDLMDHWRKVLPIPILDVDYETYTTDFESTARKIVDFAGLEWNERCLNFYEVERPVRTASQWQVRQPIYQTSVERWRNYMPHLQPLLDVLGPLALKG